MALFSPLKTADAQDQISSTPFAGTVHVFLIAGQSNANGHAPATDLPPSLQSPQADVLYYYDTLKSETPPTLGPLAPRPTFGPEITFGRSMADFYAGSGDKVAILQYAVGGSNLYAHWRPAATPDKQGPLLKAFLKTVADGMAALKQANPNAKIKIEGLLWMQGEADAAAGPPDTTEYASNLAAIIQVFRRSFGDHLPVLVGRLSSKQSSLATHLEEIRQAQESVTAIDSDSKLIDTDSCETLPDHLHFNAQGQQALGKLFATTMQAILSAVSSSTQ